MLPNCSPELIWAATKKRSSFLVKRNGLQLSAEPGNLMNANSFKFSGLANPKTVDVRQAGKGAVVVLKTKKSNAPKFSTHSAQLSKDDVTKAYKTVDAVVNKSFYRRDLTKVAMARVAKLAQASQRAAKIQAKKFSVVHGRAGPKRVVFTFDSEVAKKKKTDFSDLAMTDALAGDDVPPELVAE